MEGVFHIQHYLCHSLPDNGDNVTHHRVNPADHQNWIVDNGGRERGDDLGLPEYAHRPGRGGGVSSLRHLLLLAHCPAPFTLPPGLGAGRRSGCSKKFRRPLHRYRQLHRHRYRQLHRHRYRQLHRHTYLSLHRYSRFHRYRQLHRCIGTVNYTGTINYKGAGIVF